MKAKVHIHTKITRENNVNLGKLSKHLGLPKCELIDTAVSSYVSKRKTVLRKKK